MLIIDAHCHTGFGDGFIRPLDTPRLFRKYLSRSREAGITHTNLFSTFHSDYRSANRQIGELINAHPDLFFGFAFVHAVRDKGRIFEMVKESVHDYHFCGIKVHRHDAPISGEICEVARFFSLPVLYDIVGDTSILKFLVKEYPDVNFIIPHLGSYDDNWRAQLSFIPYLEKYENIYTDTSGIRIFELLEIAYKRAGTSKILFGTDGPWIHPSVELEKVKALKLSPREFRNITAGNFLFLISKSDFERKIKKSVNHFLSE